MKMKRMRKCLYLFDKNVFFLILFELKKVTKRYTHLYEKRQTHNRTEMKLSDKEQKRQKKEEMYFRRV